MEKRHLLPFLQAACFILLSLLLQNCGGSANLPLEGEVEATEAIEGEEQGRRKRTRIEIGEEEREEQRLIEQGQEISSFDIFPAEIWQEIFSYLDFEGVLSARAVNKDWNQLITGFREINIVGLENKPFHITHTSGWVKNKAIIFSSDKLRPENPATIPSFAFYYLMGQVEDLPEVYWPYLQETNVHTVDLSGNQVWGQVAIEFARLLQGSRVHTVDLNSNYIDSRVAIQLARQLQETRVSMVDLQYNQIGANIKDLLIEQYPHIKWTF
ncbi:MAG: F-box-like domain-containing protein [Candidatus Amoebophilus sp.]